MKLNLLKLIAVFATLFIVACNPAKQNTNEESCDNSHDKIQSETIYPEWSKDATIYEVNIRQYTPEGTFAAFEKHLPRIQKLGVKILWIMPIHPISELKRKGTLGSYYSVADYKKVNPEFGTFNEFKAFVDKAHSMGFKVILDWVANHTGWDNPWIYDHPDWFTQDSLGNIIPPDPDWTDVADLNFDITAMRLEMIDAMKFWITDTDIDGYRCDVAWGVPSDFWDQARSSLDSIKPIWMLAEDEEHKDFLTQAFNCNYSWDLHHQLNEIAQGKANIDGLKNYYATAYTTYPIGSYTMNFTSNHDENSWQGTVYERMGDAAQTMAALTFMLPGIPLIYNGQEASLDKRLLFFDKDEIDWSQIKLQPFYEKLVTLKKSNKALWNGCAGANIHFMPMAKPNNLMVFSRELSNNKIVGLFNLSADSLSNSVTSTMANGTYINAFNNEVIKFVQNRDIILGPWEYRILIKK